LYFIYPPLNVDFSEILWYNSIMNWKEKVYFPSENSKYVLSDGSLSPYWKEIRDQVLKSDNYTCQRCGYKRNLLIHHIITRIDKVSDEI